MEGCWIPNPRKGAGMLGTSHLGCQTFRVGKPQSFQGVGWCISGGQPGLRGSEGIIIYRGNKGVSACPSRWPS
ncbi:Hypothetical protein AA314_06888 [Archangium gephyra]|uniref:Uncharacterized protein n=1 Tax=Archangium gephyra TaxID=48 RepID=A0AAC8TGI8_9BACT|nr:Hypothetical protein AA314_06888 [Archangium gephyra]